MPESEGIEKESLALLRETNNQRGSNGDIGMKVWWKIEKVEKATKIIYYTTINSNDSFISITYLKSKKQIKPKRILKRRFLVFTPYPYIPLDDLKELPCFQVEDTEVILYRI